MESVKKMKILLTGGTGYIGAHTVVELQQSGFEVVIADNLSNSFADVLDAIEFITHIRPVFEQMDLTFADQTKTLFQRHRDIVGVIHFAAFKAVGESTQLPLKYYHNNLFSLVNLLNSMKEFGINKLVFSSSCTVYGQPDSLPVDENAPLQKALSPYGTTKQIAEQIIWDTIQTSNLNAVSLRYFNPIGAHESARIGELPIGVPNCLVPYITQTAIGKRPYLNIFGNDYNTPDGTCIRDYIHVVDLAKAHLSALSLMLDKNNAKNYEVFNLGTGHGYSVLEVVNSFERVSGVKLNYKIADRRPGDVEQIWASTSLANKILGWKAEKNLDDMMLSAWNWEKKLAEKIN